MNDGPFTKKNRIFVLLLCLVGVLVLWNIRLFWIQIVGATRWTGRQIDLVENSVVQREQGLILDSGRGDFVDRNGLSLTGTTMKVLAAFPVGTIPRQAVERDKRIEQAAALLKVPKESFRTWIKGLSSPEFWPGGGRPLPLNERQAEQLSALDLPELRVTTYKERYDLKQTAGQLIGYIGQNPERLTKQFTDQIHKGELQITSKIGNAGLEKTFENWLQGIGPTTVSLFTDGGKRPIPGLDIRTVAPNNPYYPLKLVTTLDKRIQESIERKLEQHDVGEGAVVVLDIDTADVVAMASRPSFQPEHIDLVSGDWSNRALKAAVPGSIFKTVTAAAALEERVVEPGEIFHCNGELGRFGFTCWKKGGHGSLTLEEGYAESCNIVFAKVAERLGGDKLEGYARKLGLTVPNGWSDKNSSLAGSGALFQQFDSEESGQVYSSATDHSDPGALVQTSIGQRDVQMTPLQAANLVVTLAHGGQARSPRIVQEIRFQNGRIAERFKMHTLKPGESGTIHKETAGTLLGWMKGVVEKGTGKALQSALWPLAGKSGTAQVRLKTGQPGENHWFIGYGPTNDPKYAVAVLIQQVPEGETNKSILLFREVMDLLAKSVV